MCERTCPKCGSTEHFAQYGIGGSYLSCSDCGTVLAARADIDAAPISTTYEEAEQWADERTWVLHGAEAKDPADDLIWTRQFAQETTP